MENKPKVGPADLPEVPVFGVNAFCESDQNDSKAGAQEDEIVQSANSSQDEVVFLEPNEKGGSVAEASAVDQDSNDEVVFLTPSEDDAALEISVSSEEVVFLEPSEKEPGVGKGEIPTITLQNKVVIANIDSLVEQLSIDVGSIDKLKLDAAEVDHIDTAGLQILVGFVNKLKKEDKELEWGELSEEIKEFAAVLALDTYLGFSNDSVEADSELAASNAKKDLCPVF